MQDSLQTVKRKPPGIIYAADDALPLLAALFNGVQHVGLVAIFLVFPLLVFRVGALPEPLIANLLAIAMLVMGIGTLLQSVRVGPVGSGYLCPSTFTAAYLGPSLLAVKTGGLSLLFGMTIFAGVLEAAIVEAARSHAADVSARADRPRHLHGRMERGHRRHCASCSARMRRRSRTKNSGFRRSPCRR